MNDTKRRCAQFYRQLVSFAIELGGAWRCELHMKKKNLLQDVHELTLVLVDTLDLDIKESIGANIDVTTVLDQLGQTDLVVALDRHPVLSELYILNLGRQSLQKREIFEPFFAAQALRDQLAQLRVGLVQPTTGRDAVGLVDKLFLSIVVHKVFENLVEQ